MSVRTIDEGIRWLTDALTAVSTTLLELESDSHWLMLDRAPVTGATAAAREQARRAVHDVWRGFTELSDLLDEARLHQVAAGRDPQAAAAIRELLWGESIVLAVTSVPVGERGLFGPATVTERCTPEGALRRMSATYDGARTMVRTVTRAWEELAPQVGAARRSLAGASVDAAGDGASWAKAVDARLSGLAERLLTDPLSVEESEVESAVAEVAALTRLRTAPDVRVLDAPVTVDDAAPSRRELRRLLTAYDAKAARLGVSEHREVAEAYGMARELLYGPPGDVALADQAVRRVG
ncbi:MAG TPA: hypothetical protein VF855_11240, partial [Acidimicrobiales bacterium]